MNAEGFFAAAAPVLRAGGQIYVSLVAGQGGMEIEEVAEATPEKIIKEFSRS